MQLQLVHVHCSELAGGEISGVASDVAGRDVEPAAAACTAWACPDKWGFPEASCITVLQAEQVQLLIF